MKEKANKKEKTPQWCDFLKEIIKGTIKAIEKRINEHNEQCLVNKLLEVNTSANPFSEIKSLCAKAKLDYNLSRNEEKI